MKKLGILILILAIVSSLIACGKVKEKEAQSNPDVKKEIAEQGADEAGKEKNVPDVSVPEEEKGDKEEKEETTADSSAPIEVPSADSFFSSLPTQYTYEKDGDKTIIKMSGNGEFTGSFKGSDGEISFKGKFSQAFPLDSYTFVSVLENYKVTSGKKDIKSAVDGMKEVVFYMPGTPTSVIADEFLRQLPGYESFGEKLPDGMYGLFDMTNRTGFYGKK